MSDRSSPTSTPAPTSAPAPTPAPTPTPTPTPTLVVLNDEEQYSIWPADRPLPAGWRQEGYSGTREDCLAHIDAVWTDMRPRSVREPGFRA